MSEMWSSDQVIQAWRSSSGARAEMMAEATQLMLQAADLKPGQKVLDIAAGMGEQSFMAARLVGSEGSVVATDISEGMLQIASTLAQEEGIANLSTFVMDAQHLDFPPQTFDAAISRHGLMFIPRLDQALTGIYHVLRDGAAFAALVWSNAENNPVLSLPMQILQEVTGLELPMEETNKVFSLSNPEELSDIFKGAGFKDVDIRPVRHLQRISSIKELLLHQKEMASGMMGKGLGSIDDEIRSRLISKIKEAFEPYEGKRGIEIPGESLLVHGTK
uniref:class I SAM-dependent methyltransferase n=1 Tax=Paenibacillus terrae TaxID=159743 RepID=UPI0011A4E9EE|nr:class I SAM-dependent methyltransferase [Paenibacillus terrae]